MVLQVKSGGAYRECSFYEPSKLWSNGNPIFEELIAQSARIRTTVITPTNEEKILYVFEGEIAQNVSEEVYDYVATDDATTCHILVAIYQLKNESAKRILVCHIASQDNCACLGDYLDRIAANCLGKIINIYLAGGLKGFRVAEEISNNVLLQLMNCKIAINRLELMFIGPLNTGADNRPVFMGFGYSKQLNTVVPLRIPLEARGPEAVHRSTTCFSNHTDLVCVYDGLVQDQLVIANLNTIVYVVDIDIVLQLLSIKDDAELLHYTSTSPAVEPPHFCSNIRRALEYIKNKNKNEKNMQMYRWCSGWLWLSE